MRVITLIPPPNLEGMGPHLEKFINFWNDSPFYSSKFDVYFGIYEDIFNHLRGGSPTFVEIGIQGGGSLFAWKKFFGDGARIIGVDLNPKCKKFEEFGFEIHIGDAGDESFMKEVFRSLGKVDAILDDGGHLYHQQINTLTSAAECISGDYILAIEDTTTSYYKEFLKYSIKRRTFSDYAKSLTDILYVGFSYAYPHAFPKILQNHKILDTYKNLHSIRFFKGITVFDFKSHGDSIVNLVTNNKDSFVNEDFRYDGVSRKKFLWPELYKERSFTVGQTLFSIYLERVLKFSVKLKKFFYSKLSKFPSNYRRDR